MLDQVQGCDHFMNSAVNQYHIRRILVVLVFYKFFLTGKVTFQMDNNCDSDSSNFVSSDSHTGDPYRDDPVWNDDCAKACDVVGSEGEPNFAEFLNS